MVRAVSLVGLSALAGGLWALYALSSDYRVFGGVSTANVLLWAAWVASALLLVLTIGRLAVGASVALLDRDTTGLQRGIIYAVVAFVVVSGILAALGANPTTLLTTSFIVTAIVGLATQSTIGGLVAGSTLQLDRALRVGDLIMINQEPIEVTSMSWRSIVGRKSSGAVAIIPNARIADSQLDVLRGDQPARVDITVTAAIAEAPHRVGQALIEAIHDLPGVDAAQPVMVEPAEYRPVEGSVVYHVGYGVRRPYDVARTRRMLVSRVWYLFQREGIDWPPPHVLREPAAAGLPQPDAFNGARLDRLADVRASDIRSVALAPGLGRELMGQTIAACGPPLHYADGERIVRPHRVTDFALFLLAEGEVRDVSGTHWRDGAYDMSSEPQTRLSSRNLAIERITSHLARAIGPYAEVAVREAAAVDPGPAAVKVAVAAEIEDAQAREAFLRGVQVDDESCYQPGFVFGLQDGAYRRVSSPPMRAVGRAVIVPITLESASRKAEPAKKPAAP
jgi:small-conductance mechanosensitive channel